MRTHASVPLPPLPAYDDEERIDRARRFRDHMSARRTVRDYADRPVPR